MFVLFHLGKERKHRHQQTQNELVCCNTFDRLGAKVDVNMLQFFRVRVENGKFSETTYSTKQHLILLGHFLRTWVHQFLKNLQAT
jgi:hypothetical protein